LEETKMTTVFIAGSITIKHLDFKVQERMMNIIEIGHDIIVGDADGADTSIQEFLLEQHAPSVTVYCTGDRPRNNLGRWPVHQVSTYHKAGSRAFFTAKDLAMAAVADTGLMIWDSKSTGTLSNVIELLTRTCNSLVFVNKEKTFQKVTCVDDLDSLVSRMAEPSRRQADTKIGLNDRITSLRSREQQFALLAERAVKSTAHPT
jgi:hypothetical protein